MCSVLGVTRRTAPPIEAGASSTVTRAFGGVTVIESATSDVAGRLISTEAAGLAQPRSAAGPKTAADATAPSAPSAQARLRQGRGGSASVCPLVVTET